MKPWAVHEVLEKQEKDAERRNRTGNGTTGGAKTFTRVNDGIAGSRNNGNAVYAVHDGSVKTVGWQNPQLHHGSGSGAGYRLQIDEGDSKVRIYGHMDPRSIAVEINDEIKRGQYLGNYADPTNGHSSGPHVHMQLMDFSGGRRRDINPGNISPLGGDGGHVTTPFGVRDALHPYAHQGTDWAY